MYSRRMKLVLAGLAFADYALVTANLCDGGIYGFPDVQDCLQALAWIPFARLHPPSPRSHQLQVFSEPQYLQPPFTNLSNVFSPNAIVQLPKIWKHSM